MVEPVNVFTRLWRFLRLPVRDVPRETARVAVAASSRVVAFAAGILGGAVDDSAGRPRNYVASLWDRTVVATAREYKPVDIERFWRDAEKGDLLRLMAFYDEMRARWPHLDAELRKAELMILSADLDIAAWPPKYRDEKDQSPEAKRAREIADYVREQFFNPSVRPHDAMRHLITGIWKQHAGLEPRVTVGGADGGRERLDALTLIPAQRFWYPKGDVRLHFQPTFDRGWTIPVEDLPDDLIVLQFEEDVPNPARRGLLRRLMLPYLVSAIVTRWWQSRVENEGQQMRTATVPVGYADRDKVLEWLKNMGTAPYAVFEDVVKLEMAAPAGDSTMHQELADFMAREVSKELHGGSQLADVQKGTGSHNNATTQERFAWMLAEGRFVWMAAGLRDRLFRHMVSRNFSPDDADRYTPELTAQFDDPTDIAVFSHAVSELNAAGVDLPYRFIYAGIGDTPKEDEPMLPGRKAAPPPVIPPPGSAPPPPPSEDPPPPKDAAKDGKQKKSVDERAFEQLAVRLNHRMAAEGVAASQRRAGDAAVRIAIRAQAGAELVAPVRDVMVACEKADLSLDATWQKIRYRHAKGLKTPKLEASLVAVHLVSMREGLETNATKRHRASLASPELLAASPLLGNEFIPAGTKAYWASMFASDPKAFARMNDGEKARAKELAGVWNANFLDDLYGSMQDAKQQGQTVAQWIKEADPILARYTAEGVDVLADPSGERADEFTSWYGDLVFRMASANAYSAGRYAQMFSPQGLDVFPFWIQSALKDDRVREDHLALDGVVFRKDDPTARQFLAPWDFNCRCLASDLSQDQIDEGGYQISRGSDFPFDAPKGFATDRVRELVPPQVRELLRDQPEEE